ncbi:MAG TPA: protein kinase [Kofleriaceae bacterium]|jgi:serine/threonine-protein kinase|nr:protein kinase [Kofleriaceae bacterium]
MSLCPAPDRLLGFASGELSDDQSASIEQHIDGCAECRAVLSNMARGGPPPSFGRYRIDTVLGSGGMGIVYRAYDPQLARSLAIKVVRRAGDDTQGRARLVREAQALARLSHPNVCHVYDVGTEGEEVWLAMELIDGVQLRQWAGERRQREEILSVLLGAAEGIAAAHNAGLVHRDIKPENVLVTRDSRAIVTDFGLARNEDAVNPNASTISADPHLTATGAIAGTPAYLAPEQLLGDPIDQRVDQFAWAVMAWELLTGSRPFPIVFAVRVEAIRNGVKAPPDLPRGLAAPLMRAMSAAPADRYPTMRELIDALKQPGTSTLKTRKRDRKSAMPIILAGAGLLALAGAAVTVALSKRDNKPTPVAATQPPPPPAPQPDPPIQPQPQPQPVQPVEQPQPQVATSPDQGSAHPKNVTVAKVAKKDSKGQPITQAPTTQTPTPATPAQPKGTAELSPQNSANPNSWVDGAGHKYCRSCQVATADAFCFIPYDFDKPTGKGRHGIVDWGTVTKVDDEVGTFQDDQFKETIITMRGQRKSYRFTAELMIGRLVTKVGNLLAVCEEDESDFYQFSGGPTGRMQAVITMSAPPNIALAARYKAQHIDELKLAAASLHGDLDGLDPQGYYMVHVRPESIDGPEWRMDRYWVDVPNNTPGEKLLAPKKMVWMIAKNPEVYERPDGKKAIRIHAVAFFEEVFPG